MYDRKDYYYDPVGHYYTYGGSTSTVESEQDWYEPPRNQQEKKKEKKKLELTWVKFLTLALIMVLISALVGFGAARMAGGGTVTIKQEEQAVSGTGFNLQEATGSKLSVQQIAKKVSDSVVSIKTESVAQSSWIREYVTEGAGSGVIIKENGYIITNNHVVEGARKITVNLDEDKDYEATLVGTDEKNDIAVLKINAKGLTAANIGKSSNLSAGDMAVVAGNPLGELGDSISAGIISSTSRKVTLENQEMNLIQTDASVNPGNSGGGLFNGSGQLIGVVVAKSSGTGVEGIGFAIPIDTAIKSAADIMNGKIDDSKNQDTQNSQDQYNNGNGNSNDNGSEDFWSEGEDPFSGGDSWDEWGGGSDYGDLFNYFFGQ